MFKIVSHSFVKEQDHAATTGIHLTELGELKIDFCFCFYILRIFKATNACILFLKYLENNDILTVFFKETTS